MNYSRQREEIVHFLKTRKDHPTAEVVYENVRMVYPKISLGTVYRNLTLLSDTGEILRLRLGDGVDHFDADTSEHYHVLCNGCGIVEDLDMKGMSQSLHFGKSVSDNGWGMFVRMLAYKAEIVSLAYSFRLL